MESNAYNKKIRDQINEINRKYLNRMQRDGYMLSDMDITPNVAMRQGEGILSTGLSLLGLGRNPKVAGEYMGGNVLDDIGRGFSQGFMMPFKLLGFGKQAGVSTGGRRYGRSRKMAGVSTGGEIALNLREQNEPLLTASGRRRKAMKEGAGVISSVLGAIGLGKEAGIQTGGRRGRKSKAMKEGEGILSGVLGAIGLGKEGGVSTGGRRRRRRAGVSTGGMSAMDRSANFMHSLGLGKEGGAMTGGRRKKGGIQTGGLARAVGSGMGELEGSGFFDDVLDKVSNVAATAKRAVDLGKDIGLIKGKGRKRAGVSTGGVSTGGKRGASPWIAHVKAFAKKHGMKYNEALKDPRTKSSYKK